MVFQTEVTTYEQFCIAVKLSVVQRDDTQHFVVSTEPKSVDELAAEEKSPLNVSGNYNVNICPREPISLAKGEKYFKIMHLPIEDGEIKSGSASYRILLGKAPKGEGVVEVEIYKGAMRVAYLAANIKYDFSEASGEMPKHQAV